MYGPGGSRKRGVGEADGDNPSAATVERRRQSDLAFLEKLKTATVPELLLLRSKSCKWRQIAIDRKLRQARSQ